MKPKTNPFLRSTLLSAAVFGLATVAQATTYYWDGTNNAQWSNTKWNTTSGGTGMNWVNSSSNDAVVNNGYVYADVANQITANSLTIGDGIGTAGSTEVKSSATNAFWNIASITINSDGALTGGGNMTTHLRLITLNGGTIGGGDNGGNAATYGVFNFDDTVHVTANSTISTTGGGVTLGQTGGTQFNVDNGATLSVTGIIVKKASSSDTGLIKTGDGTMTLSGANTYTSATTFRAGTVSVSTIGNGGVASGNLGSATNAASNLVFDGGTLKYTGNTATSDRAFTINTNKTATIEVSTGGQSLSLAGATGSATNGALTKTGAGTLTLTGANTYTGATTISNGTLKLQNSYASTGFAVAGGAVLELNGGWTGATTTFSGTGTLRKTGAGTSVWGAGVATFALGSGSLIDVQEGTFTGGSFGNEIWTNNKSDLNVAGGATFSTVEANVRVNKITGTGIIATGYSGAGYTNLTIGVDNGGSTFGGAIQNASATGNLVKAGSGTIVLTGNNTYTGTTTISGGTLNFSGNNTIGAVTANGGNVSFTGGTTTISGNLSQTMDGGNAITITNSVITLSQLYSQADDLGSKGMAFTIGAGADVTATGGAWSRTWRGSGGMFLNGGTLRTSLLSANSSTTSFLNDRAYIHFNGTKIVATANQANFIQLAAGANYANENFAKLESTTTFDTGVYGIGIGVELQGTGGLTKDGVGTLTLSGTNTYSGLTTVSAGALATTSSGSLKSGNALTLTSGTADFSNAGQTLGAVSNANTASNALNFSASSGTVTLASLSGAGNTRFGSNGTVTGGISTGTVNAVGLLTANISGGTVGAGSLSATTISGGTTTVGGVATIGTMSSGTANINGATSSISTLNGGTVNLGSSTVLTVNDGTTSGSITGSGGLTKDTSGTLTLSSGGTFNYGGATTVTNGKLVINGNISTSSLTTVQTGATLGGSGTVGALTVDAGAFITPGNSPGILNTGNYNQAGTLSVELNGTTAGSDYDRVNVTGSVTLSGALAATVGYTPVNGQLLFILLNDGIDAVSGTFSGLAQGATVSFSGFDWQISYNADSTANTFTGTANGNDIALMAVPEPNLSTLFGCLGMLALLRRRRA